MIGGQYFEVFFSCLTLLSDSRKGVCPMKNLCHISA